MFQFLIKKNQKILKLLKILEIPKKFIFSFIFITLIGSILEIIGLGSLYAFLLNFQNITNDLNLSFFNLVFDQKNRFMFLTVILLIFCLSLILKNLVIIYLNHYIFKNLEIIKKNSYTKIFKNLIYMNYLNIIKNGHIKYNQIFARYLDDCFSGYVTPLIKSISDIIILFSISLFILRVDLYISLIVIVFLLISSLISIKIFGSRLKKNSIIAGTSEERTKNLIFEFIKNYKEIFAYKIQNLVLKKFNFEISNFFMSEKKYLLTQINIKNFFEIGIIILIGMIFFYFLILGDYVNSIALIGVLGFSFVKTIPYINSIISNFNMMKQSTKGVKEIISYKKNNTHYNNRVEFKSNKTSINLEKVEIKNIKFSYDNRKIILNNLNFNIKTNETACLFGPSGSGKTTLVDVILGIIKPNEGSINFFDKEGKIIKGFNNFSYVSQNPCIFKGSILENITFKSKLNKNEEKRIKSILKDLDFESILNNNKLNKNSLYLEGQNLSGGQRQKISFARALFSDAKIIFVDEGTSNLDELSEKKIFGIIKKIKKNKIIFFITHKISNKSFFDKIIYLSLK